jgi:type I restriction enzyme, S subunit
MTPNWGTITVRELVARSEAEIKTGPFGTQLHASDYVESGTPVLNARNIGFGDIRPEKLEFISDETVQRLSSHLLKRGDIIFGRKGTVERHAFIRPEHEGWFQGTDCLRLRLKGPTIDARFASYCFLVESHKQWIMNQSSHGATMTSLNQDIISRIVLPSPPLATQRKIAAILSAYDDLIEVNTRRIAILEEMARGLYREWFVRFRFPGHEGVRMVESAVGLVPEGWEVASIRDVTTYVNRGVSPKYDDGSLDLVVNQRCIRDGRLNVELARRHSTRVPSDKRIRFGDVLINSTGIGTLGRIAQVCEDLPNCTVDSHVSIVRPAAEVNIDYFGAYLSTLERHFDGLGTGSTGQTELSRESIAKTAIVLPPRVLQERHGETVSPMRRAVVLLHAKNANLRRTRDLLLPRLVAGEVGVDGVA